MLTHRAQGWYAACAIGGAYAHVVRDSHLIGNGNRWALPSGRNLDCIDITPSGNVAGSLGDGKQDWEVCVYENGHCYVGPVPARNAIAFNDDGSALYVCRVGSVSRYTVPELVSDGSIPLDTGSQGIRFISWDGRPIPSEPSMNEPTRTLFEFIDYGDVAIGHGNDGVGCLVRFPDGYHVLEAGDAKFIRVHRRGNDFAIAFHREDTRESVFYWATLEELRACPLLVKPVPPPPTPPPVELPMSDLLTSTNERFRLVMQNDGNVVVYGPDRTAKGLTGLWPWGETPPPQPVPSPDGFGTWPRRGLSYYASLTDPRLEPKDFFSRLASASANFTRTWLFDAWAVDQGGPGQYSGFVPFSRIGGRWDLHTPDPRYLERLRAYTRAANDAGVLPQFTGLELYTWSDRKAGMLWVPDQSKLWMQHNVQELVYADDNAFETLATEGVHGWLGRFYRHVVQALDGLHYVIELGNEMPEKPLHERLARLWRAAGYMGPLSVNRQEDTPGQYANMKIGANYDLIAFHGKKDLNYLDEVFADEPVYRTFRAFYESGSFEPSRITLSSDGCRKTTSISDAYDYDALKRVFQDGLVRGFGIEHQSRLKLRSFTHGHIDLDDLETDWFRTL